MKTFYQVWTLCMVQIICMYLVGPTLPMLAALTLSGAALILVLRTVSLGGLQRKRRK